LIFRTAALAVPLRDTLRPSRPSASSTPCVRRRRHIGSEGPLRPGQAARFAPLSSASSARGCGCTDPTIASALDGSKYSRLSRGLVYRPSPLRSFTGRPPVSQTTGFPHCPAVRRLRGAGLW
jgi:hypothetical protein